MYKKVTHTIVEEHFPHLTSMPHHLAPKKKENEEDVVHVNVPLMIRLLEWAREDANKDADIHVITERLVELSSEEGDVLGMSDYPKIVYQKDSSGQED